MNGAGKIESHAAAYTAARALHTALVIEIFRSTVVSANAAAGAAAKYYGGVHNISAVGAELDFAAVVARYTAEHKALCPHEAAVYAFFHISGVLLAACVFAGNAANKSNAVYVSDIGAFGDNRALFIECRNTCGMAAAAHFNL